jgi:hypothetical protein
MTDFTIIDIKKEDHIQLKPYQPDIKPSKCTKIITEHQLDDTHHNETDPCRTKIKTISERENFNTDADINTDELGTDITVSSNEHEQPVSSCDVREYSISTLDRKLKELKKLKRNRDGKNKKRLWGLKISKTKNVTNRHNDQKHNHQNLSQRFSMNHMNNVTIMMNPSKLINEHMNEIQLRIIGHTRAAISYEKKEKIIGYPVTILSSFLTSTIMMSISSDESSNKDIIKYVSLSLSITSFLFSVSRDYLNFARKFQSHDLSSKLYTTVLRSVEVRLINNHLDKDDRREIFKDIVDQMSIIEQYEQPVPLYIDTRVRKDHSDMIASGEETYT